MDLEPLVEKLDLEGDIPPVEEWHPEQVGEMDLVIAADGRWVHEGTVMSRPRLVRLLSTLLRRDADGRHVLVTPAEKQRIRVEDCPFLIVDAEYGDDGLWWLTTNMGDRLALDAEHPFTLSKTPTGECVPEVPVRFGLTARLGRNIFYRLVEEAAPFTLEEGREAMGLHSGGGLAPAGPGRRRGGVRLTDEQRAVVEHGAGHARVAAVAGSGKTTTMVARVLRLLERGVPPQRILVLMFNRSARADFQARLAAMAPAGQRLPDVRTFHSLGHRLTGSLTRWGALAPRQLLTADWQLERLLRQATQLALGDQDTEARESALDAERLEALAHFCGLVKAELVSAAELHERLDYGEETRYFPAAFEQVEALLEQHGLMGYADLLYRPLRVLEAGAGLRGRIQGYLDHVIIDEYQDLNIAQQRLLALLAGGHAEVMAVGDANQCIYEWRGAHPETMLQRFTATFGLAVDYPLSTTFRHGHALALAANHAIDANRRRPDQQCLAAPGNPQTRIEGGVGSRGLLGGLISWQKEGRALGEACVLVRSWALSVPLQLALLREGVAFRLAREDRFVFRLPLVQALAGYLRLACTPELLRDPAHLALLFSQPTPFVARERLEALARRLAESQRWPASHDPLLTPLKPHQKRTLKKRWALLCELPRLASHPPAELLDHVVAEVDAEKVLKRAAARRDKGEEDVRLLDVLKEQAIELGNDTEAFVELLSRPVESRDDGVLINTVHGAKGLEWPLVVLAGVNEQDFPHYTRDNPLSPQRLEEERRLFYVAITRARERLLLLHDGGDHRPSRFLAESAWQECDRLAQRLASDDGNAVDNAGQTPLVVSRPGLVKRYLDALGRELPLASVTPETTEQVASAQVFGVGQRLRHAVFGEGEIDLVEGDPDNPVIEVRFQHAGRRRLIARRAPIELLNGG